MVSPGWGGSVDRAPAEHRGVQGSSTDQGSVSGLQVHSQLSQVCWGRQPINVSLLNRCFSVCLSLSPSPPPPSLPFSLYKIPVEIILS